MVDTIRNWLASVLGEYTPVTYEVTSYATDPDLGLIQIQDEVVASGLAGVDWEYIATAALLLIAIWSVFRLLGVLLQTISGGK